MYTIGNFILNSDFEVRFIREADENGDVDLFIPVDNRTVNVRLPFLDVERMSRMQLSQIKSIVIRLNEKEEHTWCSIHFLNSIDLLSHVLNFDVNYEGHMIWISKEEYSVEFKVIPVI